MPRQIRGGIPKDDIPSQGSPNIGIPVTNDDGLLTLRIDEQPLTLLNVAATLTAITRLHTKLWLIERRRSLDLVYYASTHDNRFTEEAKLTAVSITQNSPLTIVLTVSEALGKALASLIDAVAHTRQRYQMEKLRVDNAKLEHEAQVMRLKQEAQTLTELSSLATREKAVSIRERELRLKEQEANIKLQELQVRQNLLNVEVWLRKQALDLAVYQVERLYPSASLEAKEMMAQALMEELLQLGNSAGLTVYSFKPRQSA
jgi:hypothetical protein